MHEPRATAGVAHARVASVSTTRSGRVALALIAAMVATLLGGLPGTADADAAPGATDQSMTRVVVQARQDIGAAAATVAAQGGRVLEVIAPLGVLVAEVPADAVASIETDASTASVTADFPLRVQSADDDKVARADAKAERTPKARTKPHADGAGIVVVDTGIAQREDLNVVASYDLTTGKGNHRGNHDRGTASQDAHGHGTFLAGVAAGDGEYAGVAAGAPLVSVRVADADGSTTLSRVLHGLAIADAARTTHDAPVVLLALAGDPGDTADPLMITLEMLWARGSTVVVPSGNRGQDKVTSPGTDPYLITVGAEDADGAPAAWSGKGTVSLGHEEYFKPEVHAPGTSVVGPKVEGSTIASASNGDLGEYMRGTGTSMAAAHVAGQAAELLAADSSLTPTQVKDQLMGTPANVGLEPLPEAVNPDRGNGRATAPGQLRRTAMGLQTAGWTWAGWTWAGWTWAGNGDADIDGDDWAGWTWANGEWAGWTWANQDWAGWTWADDDWAGWTWAGWTWAGWTWAGWTWAAADWGTLH